MKNLTALLKNSISTLCLLFVLCITSDAQLLHNFTKVQQHEGLIMRRAHGVGEAPGIAVMNFHSDDTTALSHPDYIYMRATAKTDSLNPNNLVFTDRGLLLVGAYDECRDFELPALEDTNEDIHDVKLYVNGKIAVSDGNATNLIVSDERFKKNIVPLKNSLEIIRQSNFVEYQYNDLSGVRSDKKYYGILAQEMKKILPSTVSKSAKRMRPTDKKSTEFFMFNPNDLIYSGLNAIKELDKENQDLKNKVAELEKEVEKNITLEQRVSELENMLRKLVNGEDLGELNDLTPINTIQNSSYLSQNQPNPLHKSTEINYQLPDNTSTAYMVIQDLNGQVITRFNLQKSNTGSITFDAKQYGITNGTYAYSLIVNEVLIESKKMIFIK